MARTRSVELTDEELEFLRSCLQVVALRVRDHPADPELARLVRPDGRELTLIAGIESALADARDIG
jgi:hypothetical protein